MRFFLPIVDLCACKYEADDSDDNPHSVLTTTMPMILEVGGKKFPTL